MERPTSVTVFGILNLVFGVLGLCGMGAALAIQAVPAARVENPIFELADENPVFGAGMAIMTVLGTVATLVLIPAATCQCCQTKVAREVGRGQLLGMEGGRTDTK